MGFFTTTDNNVINTDHIVRAQEFLVVRGDYAVLFELVTGTKVIIEGLSEVAAKKNIELMKSAATT